METINKTRSRSAYRSLRNLGESDGLSSWDVLRGKSEDEQRQILEEQTLHYERCRRSVELLRLFLEDFGESDDEKEEDEGDDPPDQSKPDKKDEDDEQDQDPEWKDDVSKRGWRDDWSWKEDGSSSSSWKRSNWNSSSKNPHTYYWQTSKRWKDLRSSSAVLRPLSCGGLLRVAMACMAVERAAGMEIVPYGGAPLATIGALGTAGTIMWTAFGATLFTTIIPKVPIVVEQVTDGVQEIVEEVIVGSKLVVRSVSYAALVLATLAVLRLAFLLLHWIQGWIKEKLNCCKRPDAFKERYGGRLLGGGKKSLAVRDLFGSGSKEGTAASSTGTKPKPKDQGGDSTLVVDLDLDRLKTGDRISFVYFRGTRSGKRRTVTVMSKDVKQSKGGWEGILLRCKEEDGATRSYWPTHIADVDYNPDGSPDAWYSKLGRDRPEYDAQGNQKKKEGGRVIIDYRSLNEVTQAGTEQTCRSVTAADLHGSREAEQTRSCDTAADLHGSRAKDKGKLMTAIMEGVSNVFSSKSAYPQAQPSTDLDSWKQGVGLLERANFDKSGKPYPRRSHSESSPRRSLSSAQPPLALGDATSVPATDTDTEAAKKGEPEVIYYTAEHMLPMVTEVIAKIQKSFKGMQYVLDHTDLCLTLTLKASKGVKGKLIFDRENFFNSSCARQPARVAELFKEGVEMRVCKPKGAGFACMHVKSWIFDEKVLVDGSCNLTHNGLENNVEHMFKITNPECVRRASESFDEVWKMSEPVMKSDIERVLEIKAKREQKRGQSLPRGASRSLSQELDDAATKK